MNCQVCGEDAGGDIRHVGVECFYDLSEISGKLTIQTATRIPSGQEVRIYSIKVCKGCRSVFMVDYLKHFIEHGGGIRRQKNLDTDACETYRDDSHDKIWAVLRRLADGV